MRSRRRGQGAEIVGSRRYVPGDRLAWIDWYASARESTIRDDDVFIVRQYYTELAPRVIVLADRQPSMTLYPPGLPWLSKPAVAREATTAIVAAARAVRAYVGYLDLARGSEGAVAARWLPPQRGSARQIFDRLDDEVVAPANSLEFALDYLLELPSDAPEGTFTFAISDFLTPVPDHVWSRVRARGWDFVPVIVQDRVWEQSFPHVEGLLLPVRDPESGKRSALRLTAHETEERRQANAARLEQLVDTFRRLRFDPVLLDTPDPIAVDAAFLKWAARRRAAGRRAQ